MVTVEDLRAYVNASASDTDFLDECLTAATALVNAYTDGVSEEIPATIYDIAYTQVASELFHRRNAPNGVTQYAAFDGTPVRAARDPMTSTYPILNKFVLSGV